MRVFLLLVSFLMLMSCVTHLPQYANDNYDPEQQIEDSGNRLYNIYFIGDAGNAPENETVNVLKFLKSKIACDTAQSAIVWLGDNIYPVGLAPEGHPDHVLGKHRLLKQLEVHDDYKGRIYFMPGNHDWYKYGKEGLARQESIIEAYLSARPQHNAHFQDNYFLPDDGCGQIHTIALTEDISMLIMDSAWFLSQTKKGKEIQHCHEKTIPGFLKELSTTISRLKGKTVIVAMHHPPYTFGSHGGKFKFKDYLFPLSQLNDNLLIPLPLTGLIVNKMRNYVSEQDSKSPKYRLLREKLEEALEEVGASMIVGGHEHNMQYIELEGNYFVVSGAGSKNNPVGLGHGSQFSVGEKGYVKLEFITSTVAVLKYFVVDEEGDSADLVYQKILTFGI